MGISQNLTAQRDCVLETKYRYFFLPPPPDVGEWGGTLTSAPAAPHTHTHTLST